MINSGEFFSVTLHDDDGRAVGHIHRQPASFFFVTLPRWLLQSKKSSQESWLLAKDPDLSGLRDSRSGGADNRLPAQRS